VRDAAAAYELIANSKLMKLSREFALFVMDVLAIHGKVKPCDREPIPYLGLDDFATHGERWEHKKEVVQQLIGNSLTIFSGRNTRCSLSHFLSELVL
jgi:hypothetical protein